ncbi:golgin subfamily A member [Acrasis kona]|uniref:Golgin subfamily A member n=1 Tax=Acrasis kona TaxID=1008807 RepID=A0AAW2ZD02_9EUKA
MTMKQPKKAEKQPEEPKSEPTNIPDVSVEEGKDVTPNEDPKDPITTPTTSDPSETKLIEENKFLKQNIAHLHEEVQEVNRIKEIVSNKYKDLVKQLQNKEQYTKESQDRLENQVSRLLGDKLKTDTEFASALDDREKTQKQLQKKIDELIQQLKAKDSQVSDLQQEKIRLANESLQHQRHFDEESNNLKNQLETKTEELQNEKERTKTLQSEFTNKESNLLDEKNHLENEYTELNTLLTMKNEDASRFENLIKIKDTELKLKEQELAEYKQRAAKVLLIRDKQIEELKKNLESSNGGDSKNQNSSSSASSTLDDFHDSELLAALDREDLNMDLDRLRGENQELLATIDLLKRQSEAETTSNRFKIRNLEKSIEKEKQNSAKTQQTIASLKLNSDEMRHRFEMERKSSSDGLKNAQLEIKKLNAIIVKSQQAQNNSHGELEMRARVMAESLIEKQSQLETLNSEKAALALELEKSKQRIREVELISRVTPITPRKQRFSNVDDDDDDDGVMLADSTVTVKRHKFFRNLSNRGFLAKKFATSVGALDRFSIMAGRYLKRLPILRMFFVLYLLTLHLWVIYVTSHNVHEDSLHNSLSHADTFIGPSISE